MALLRGTARSISSYRQRVWMGAPVVLGSALILGACKPDKCKGECSETRPSANVADAAPSTGASSNQPNTSTQAGTSSSETTGSSPVVPQVFSCRDDSDCVATPFPACSVQLRQCVTCTQNDHCGVEKPRCAIRASDELNRCVECQTGLECASGLCRDDVCLVCDPQTNQGCNTGICLATEGQAPECVECSSNDDCSAGVCIDHQCRTCDVRTGAGCVEGTICLPRSELEPNQVSDASVPPADAGMTQDQPASIASDGICVECAASRPCADPDFSVCLNNTCVACDPETTSNNGCTPLTPFCLSGSEPTADADSGAAVNRCVECLESADCENAQCVDHTCQPCDPTTHAGCADGDICLPRPKDNFPTGIAYECLECNDEKVCEGNEHCGADGKCRECLDSSHCTDRSRPFCQPDGACGICTQDDECPSGSHCWLETGECVACTKDEHCLGSASGEVCYLAKHTCVECTATNLDACGGNPCRLLPGEDEHTCFDDESSLSDGGASTECRRCTGQQDCDANTECAALSDANLRCVPLATEAAGRTDCEVRDVVNSEGQTQSYCVPFGC